MPQISVYVSQKLSDYLTNDPHWSKQPRSWVIQRALYDLMQRVQGVPSDVMMECYSDAPTPRKPRKKKLSMREWERLTNGNIRDKKRKKNIEFSKNDDTGWGIRLREDYGL